MTVHFRSVRESVVVGVPLEIQHPPYPLAVREVVQVFSNWRPEVVSDVEVQGSWHLEGVIDPAPHRLPRSFQPRSHLSQTSGVFEHVSMPQVLYSMMTGSRHYPAAAMAACRPHLLDL